MPDNAWSDIFLRTGRRGRAETVRDVLWLTGFVLLLIGVGLGLRDPWPPDEPRFALVARDMVASGDWLIPRVGGDLYADKPPLYFWCIAAAYWALGSLRVAFLLPSLLATMGSVLLIYDLARRLWDRETGFAAALLLLVTFQFLWQGRQAQIDATLCFWTTLGLYGLLRHLLLGPAWFWYALGWAAAGLGVITKGVGFLPILLLIPYSLARAARWQAAPIGTGGARWLLGPLAFIGVVCLWLVPVLIAASRSPELAQYRDEILFHQTLTRYAAAWHHHEPFWYFVIKVIPVLWLPLTLLLPWLVLHWRSAIRGRDLKTVLPLAWAVLVVLFFSLSAGKRGIYVLPALPACVLAAAPFLLALARKRTAQAACFVLALLVALTIAAAALYTGLDSVVRDKVIARHGIDPLLPLVVLGAATLLVTLLARPRRGVLAYVALLAMLMPVIGLWINPLLDRMRSGASFMLNVERQATHIAELGLVAYKEQYLLESTRPTFNFGHSRWLDADSEMDDAAAWLVAAPGRGLLIDQATLERCFDTNRALSVGRANRKVWYLVTEGANPACADRGDPVAARYYDPLGGRGDGPARNGRN